MKNVFLAEVVTPVAKPMDSDGNGVTDHMVRCLDTSQGVRVDARGLDTEKEP